MCNVSTKEIHFKIRVWGLITEAFSASQLSKYQTYRRKADVTINYIVCTNSLGPAKLPHQLGNALECSQTPANGQPCKQAL